MGIGAEFAFSGVLYQFVGEKPKHTEIFFPDSTFPYLSLSIPFDIYSPNSVIGLYTEASYSIVNWALRDTLIGFADGFKMHTLEIPLYLKIRPGTMGTGRAKFWLLLGGSFALPVISQRATNYETSLSTKNFAKPYAGVGGAVGLELKLGRKHLGIDMDKARMVFYLRANYSMMNKFNGSALVDSNPIQEIDYSKIDVRDVVISLGMKFLFRIKKPKKEKS